MGKTTEDKIIVELRQLAQAIAGIERTQTAMQADIHDVKQGFSSHSLDMAILKKSQRQVLGRLRALEENQSEVLEKLTALEDGHTAHTKEIKRLGVLLEATDEKIDQVIEGMIPEVERTTAQLIHLNDHDDQLEKHDLRLRVLELEKVT